ncbi:GTPase IMAP family member 7-like isoform X2 [Cyclopterus lumpus]|uniref:AIG1-type G domain-containing protein n=1 Tax=Cyclopterus lumpus TaxID=8103 RepID=A0A8C3G927_CYCLU|nr:GTPase IMAP family member 7-like isoform X1 [Cyclopterus lumpus]XP_034382475.1 GTPase IMAP family member 7-like isoform X2 [Cyclopterus lumpus]
MDMQNTWRIVLLGKTGVGKSSLANNIFGDTIFKINILSDLETHSTTAQIQTVTGRSITLIDTPGFFDPSRSEEEMNSEMMSCIAECAPGPHVFLIVLKVEKFVEHNEDVVSQIYKYFSKNALKYAVIVFTHGDQLQQGMTLEKYIEESGNLGDLVKKCGDRCHVVDNKYWKGNQGDDRCNEVQVAKLLTTITQLVLGNKGEFYTDKNLRGVREQIQKEEDVIRLSSGNMSQEEIVKQAKSNVVKKQIDAAAKTWGSCFKRFAIIAGLFTFVSTMLLYSRFGKVLKKALPFYEE